MADGMEKMLRMLSILSDLQDRRQRMTMQQQQFEEQKKQFAAQIGLSEKTANLKEFNSLLDRFADATTETRATLEGIGVAAGLDAEQLEALRNYGANASQSLTALRTQAANKGMQPGATGLQQEAYNVATTGMNAGQMGQSGMQSSLLGNFMGQMQQNPGMATRMASAFGTQAATGQSELGYAQGQALLSDPKAVQQSAAIQAGIAPSFAQAGQLELGMENLKISAQQLAAQLNSAKATGALTNEQRIAGVTQLSNIVEALGAKQRSEADRIILSGLANQLAQVLGLGIPFPSTDTATQGRGITGGLFGSPPMPQMPQYPGMPMNTPNQVVPPGFNPNGRMF